MVRRDSVEAERARLTPALSRIYIQRQQGALRSCGRGFRYERGAGGATTFNIIVGMGLLCVLNVFTNREW